jgi:flagellin
MSLFSVNTNLGALAALQSLEATQQSLNETQNEVSTGQKVSSAADNPAIYSIANTINANIAGLSAVSDSLNFGAQVVSAASSAVQSISSVLDSLQQTVTSSITSGESLTTLQQNVDNAITSINQYASDATFSGVNLLVATAPSGGSNSLNVVQSVDGNVYSVANQITATGATQLSDQLGLTNLNVLAGDVEQGSTIAAGSAIGANISFGAGTTVGQGASGNATAGTFQLDDTTKNAAIQITLGGGTTDQPEGNTITFEFNDLANPDPLQSQDSSNSRTDGGGSNSDYTTTNTTIAVNFDSTTDSTNQVVAKLAAALNANGFGVVQQADGSLSIVGQNITGVAYGSVATNVFTAESATKSTPLGGTGSDAALYTTGLSASSGEYGGVEVSALTPNQVAVTTVQTAVSKLNTISATLGAATQQITGIQNFTSALSSALTAGVGALTDADLASESARLTSLQTKQQLATQSLTIANQQPQSLLTLFKNA